MSLRKLTRVLWNRKQDRSDLADVERDCVLRVFMNDTKCELIILDKTGQQIGEAERLVSDNVMETQSPLLTAVEALPPELERRIGNVEVFLDDAEISVVDSRQAKLSHFEGRALAEFGKYQLGGKPVCFASHRFGETSAQETEKRIVAYISEERLTSVLFSLGKLSRFTTFFGPWSLQGMLSGDCEETRAQLSVHGHYSTLTLANASAGAVAVRHLPVGTANIANAYAAIHGIDAKQACEALASRSRLSTDNKGPLPAAAPAVLTGTRLALAPVLGQLSGEVAATADYFEFQRLAGRALDLQLSVLGARVAGFANWLSNMLQTGVSDVPAAHLRPAAAPVLNLLDGTRTGLLKLGNQHYDFVGGRFVPSAAQAGSVDPSSAAAKWKSVSSQQVSLETFKPMAVPATAAVGLLMAIVASYAFLLAPTDLENQTSVNLYGSMLARLDQAKPHVVPAVGEPVLWAKDLMSVGSAMPYDMKLKRIALIAGAGATGTSFEISGTLPRDGKDNLQLIGRFMSRLTTSPALRRRFSDVNFAGTGQGDTKDSGETIFRVVGKVAGGAKP